MKVSDELKEALRNAGSTIDAESVISELEELLARTADNDTCKLREPLTLSEFANICEFKNVERADPPPPAPEFDNVGPVNFADIFSGDQPFTQDNYDKLPEEIKKIDRDGESSFEGALACLARVQETVNNSNLDELQPALERIAFIEEQIYIQRFYLYIIFEILQAAVNSGDNVSINMDFEAILQEYNPPNEDLGDYEHSITAELLERYQFIADNGGRELADLEDLETDDAIDATFGIISSFNDTESLDSGEFLPVLDLEDFVSGEEGSYFDIFSEENLKPELTTENLETEGAVSDAYTSKQVSARDQANDLISTSISDSIADIILAGSGYIQSNSVSDLEGLAQSGLESLVELSEELNENYAIVARSKNFGDKLRESIINSPCAQQAPVDESTPPPAEAEARTGADPKFAKMPENPFPNPTTLDYWKIYSRFLTTINLIPTYWKVGLLIPTPGGIVRVPLPIVWKPMFVVYTPLGLIVIFITINGILVTPAVWFLSNLPVSDGTSSMLLVFRGANLKIKDKTQTTTTPIAFPLPNDPTGVGAPIVADAISALSATIIVDDLPVLERLSLLNPPYLVYLNQWLSTATPNMGFP